MEITRQIIKNPSPSQWLALAARPVADLADIEQKVAPILQDVKAHGDAALRKYARRFDKVEMQHFGAGSDEIDSAAADLPDELKEAIAVAAANIEKFHAAQLEQRLEVETAPGVVCWRKSVPIRKVGFYIPGGTAPLFSTVLMLGIPARIAGCTEVLLCTPPSSEGNVHPAILYSANLLGIRRVFKIGGAQAIAAMAYGTESIPRVDKIFGPGNQYVTAAKQLVSKEGIAIDMPAGPTELAVLTDASCRPEFVAADLLSQAEHGTDSQVVLVSTDEAGIDAIHREITRQIARLPRKEIAAQALAHSRSILFENLEVALEFINAYAPEHLIIATDDARKWAEKVENAGSVFVGHYAPESAGDYASGTNHTLPTNGFARAFSGVSVDSFCKKITFQQLTEAGLRNIGRAIEVLAEAEELHGHKRAVSVRLQSRD